MKEMRIFKSSAVKFLCAVLLALLSGFLQGAAPSGIVEQAFSKSRVVREALWQGDSVSGVLEIKLGKVSKQNEVKVSAKCYLRDGTKVSASAVKVPVVQREGVAELSNVPLKFKKPLPAIIPLTISAQAGSGGISYAVYTEESAGSYWVDCFNGASRNLKDGAVFEFEDEDFIYAVEHFSGLMERLPEGVSVVQNGTAWRVGANDAMLKLRYAPRSMTFKGTFKLFFPIWCGNRQKIRKFTTKVAGFVYDGAGYGVVTCKSVYPGRSWAIAIR